MGKSIPIDDLTEWYVHCDKCLTELQVAAELRRAGDRSPGNSPREYARLSVGFSPIGLQVWCARHEMNVLHVDFEDARHPAALPNGEVDLVPLATATCAACDHEPGHEHPDRVYQPQNPLPESEVRALAFAELFATLRQTVRALRRDDLLQVQELIGEELKAR